MISVGKMYAKFEKYTEKEDYYAKSEGQWYGKGAERLGLEGAIKKEDFQNLRQGNDLTGNQIVEPGVNGKHRDGYDLTFSAPKSVSILREIGDSNLRKAIDRSWDKVIDQTLNHIEERYIQARQMVNGKKERVNTQNAIWGKFNHEGSRELDMQKHTHATLLNVTHNDKTN